MKLNKQQQEASTTLEGNIVVISAAGSGKCLEKNTMIYTDKGIIRIKDVPNYYNVNELNEVSATVRTVDIDGVKTFNTQTSHFYNMGESDTISVSTSQGYTLEGTPEHPIVVLNESGNLEFVKLKDITDKSIIAMSKNNDLWGKDDTISMDMSYFIGLLIGDGYLNGAGGQISFSKSDPYFSNQYINLILKLFEGYGINIKKDVKKDCGSVDWRIHSMKVKDLLRSYGLKMALADEKEIPQLIMNSPREVVIECMRGLFDTDGHCGKDGVLEYCTKSKVLAEQMHMILLNLGIVSRIKIRRTKGYDFDYYYLYISGTNGKKFNDLIGFKNALIKKERTNEYYNNKKLNDNINVLYYQQDRLRRLRDNNLRGKHYYDGHKMRLKKDDDTYVTYKDYVYGDRNPSPLFVEKLLDIIDFTNEDIEYLDYISKNFFFDKVDKINYNNNNETVYDFTVPDTHSFISNGFVSHNTAVLTNRMNNMIASGIAPSNIAAITFSKNGADNMISRMKEKFNLSSLPLISTCHSIGLGMLKQFAGDSVSNGVTTDYWVKTTIIDICVKKLMLFKNEDLVPHAHLKNYFDSMRIGLCGPNDELVIPEKPHPMLTEYDYANIYKAYEKAKIKAKKIDYTDMLFKAYVLLRDNGEVRRFYQGKYKYLLVDEAQDCNLLQIELIRLINTKNVFMVADFQQSIFSFLGCSPQFVLNFKDYFPDGKYLNLSVNYRSTTDIVENGNKLLSNSEESNHEAYVEAVANRGRYKKPQYKTYFTPESEARDIADKCLDFYRKGQYAFEDVAILMRTNSQSSILQTVFAEKGIPFEVIGGDEYFNRKEIRDSLNFLKVIHSGDTTAFKNIYNTPSRYLGKEFLKKLEVYSKGVEKSLVDSLRGFERVCDWRYQRGVNSLIEIIKMGRLIKNTGNVGDVINAVLNTAGYIDFLKSEYEDDSRIENIGSLITQADKYKDIGEFLDSIQKVLEHTDRVKKQKKKDGKINAVKIMTVHKSKGLEFPVVFVVSMNEGVFPHSKSDNIDEERRLAYVAVTRPEKELYLSSTLKFNKKDAEPSQFIYEMGYGKIMD